MANSIRILRSVGNTAPTGLAQGELAYVEQSGTGDGRLYIGAAGSTVEVVGGQYFIDLLNSYDTDLPTFVLPASTTISAFGATIVDDADAAAVLTTLGVDTDLTTLTIGASATVTGSNTGDQTITLTSDVTGTGTGSFATTIAADAVTYSKMQNVVAADVFLGNTGIAGSIVAELTGTQATEMLDAFITTSTVQGVVPGSNSLGATYYLDGSGAWSVPPGGAASNSFATMTVDDTDTEYTWAALGSVVADSSTDTLTWVSGIGIDIDSDAALDALRVSADFSSLPVTVPVTGDWIAFDDAGVSSKALISAIPLSIFSNDSGWTANAGTVTSVVGGVGVSSSGGAAPSIALTVDELAEKTGAVVGTDRLVGTTATTNWAETISGVPLSIFNNDSGWEANDAATVLTTDAGSATWTWIIDEDAMGSDSDVHVPTQQSVKAYVDSAVTSGVTYKGGYNASTNVPALDTGTPTLVVGDMYTVTVAGTFFTVELEVGDVLIAEVDSVDAAAIGDWTIVQANIGAASETAAGYIELATQTEMNTGTDDLRAVTPLKYANSIIDGGTF